MPENTAQLTHSADICDLVNVVGFALGVEMQYLRSGRRTATAFPAVVLHGDRKLCRLRALCTIQSILLKTFPRMRTTPSVELKPFSTLLHFPEFVREELTASSDTVLTSTGSLTYRFNLLRSEIVDSVQAIQKYIPAKEPHPEWILSLFEPPAILSEADLTALSQQFLSNISAYPYRVYINCHPSPSMLDSDYYLMFAVYKEHNRQLEDMQLYKGLPPSKAPKEDYGTISGTNDALEFLKASLSDEGERRLALVDTQNMTASDVYEFLEWIRQEYPTAFQAVVLFVDGHEAYNWNIAESMIRFPVRRVTADRVLDGKSMVDTILVATAIQTFYAHGVDSLYIISGDSDFLPLADILPDVKLCFCGKAGSTSRRAIEFTKQRSNAKFIVVDELLFRLKSITNGYRNDLVDELVQKLNRKELDVSGLVEQVKAVCNDLGRRDDNIIAVSMLNHAFSSFHLRVTEDGHLEFKLPWERWW